MACQNFEVQVQLLGSEIQDVVQGADKKNMRNNLDVALKSVENQQEREISSRFSARMKASVGDLGKVDTMRHTILSYVAAENYEKAIEELSSYVQSKSDYPEFEGRSTRYTSYAVDLINAVKAKRSFPGLQHLSMSKQQELFDRAMSHFEDLKATLKKVEQIEREVRLKDVRSTVLVLRAVIYCAFVLFGFFFLKELSRGIWPSLNIVLDDYFSQITNFVFDYLGM